MRKSELRERIVFKLTKKTDASKHAKIDINIARSVLYINAVESTVKGIGALLLYIVACKAKALRLPVKFVAIPGLDYGRPTRLFEHYNSLHFKREGNVSERERDGPSQWYKTEGKHLDDLILKKVQMPMEGGRHKKTRKNRGNARNSRNRTDI
jgi:hypothetical protein